MIIAIDGPAASGKGTLGKRLAHHYHYRHLDTGVIYRAVAKVLLDAGADLTDEDLAVAAAMELDPERFGNPASKTQLVGEAASVVSAIPRVREEFDQFSAAVRGGSARCGARWPRYRHRDLPARRREDLRRRRPQGSGPAPDPGKPGRGEAADEAAVLADILRRDERDQNRAAAPLMAAADAHLLDNSHLDIESGVRAAIDIVEAVRAGRHRV